MFGVIQNDFARVIKIHYRRHSFGTNISFQEIYLSRSKKKRRRISKKKMNIKQTKKNSQGILKQQAQFCPDEIQRSCK